MAATLQNEVLSCNMDHPLGRWRHRRQMSQDALGKLCGLSQKAISAYESGTRVPRENRYGVLRRSQDCHWKR